LAEYYQGVGINVQKENVIVTTGGSEALLFGMMSCLNPGDEIIIPEPFYANYNSFAVTAGIKVVPVTAVIENGFALPPVSEFEKKITPNTRAILICNPGNPTGSLYKMEELEQLREIVAKHDFWLFADEVYREFCYDNLEHHSVMNLAGIEQNVILVDSVSKRYSMCGARIGAMVSHNIEVLQTALKFAQARLSPPTLGQIAGEAALQTPASYFEEVTAEYVQRRDVLVDGLNEIPGVVCPKPEGAFYCIAELPVENAEDFCQWMLESFAFENQTVMMAPAAGFYASPDTGVQQVRIAYVLHEGALRAAVRCLSEALKVYPGRIQEEVLASNG
jgi:aspartate aminotransferase